MNKSKLELIVESAFVLFLVAAVSAVVAIWANDNARQSLRWERYEAQRAADLERRALERAALAEGRAH